MSRLFDLGHHRLEDGSELLFITMELLEGETLSDRLKRDGKMTPEQALPLVKQIALALSAAHAAAVVHRDIKPSNILLLEPKDGSGLKAVVTDFGVAHGVMDPFSELSTTGEVVGSPVYMTPEQLEGQEITAQTDIYALGLLLYEMVTGQRPFAGDSTLGAAVKRLHEAPSSPTTLVPTLEPRWSQAIMRCLELEPKRRYASCDELVDALTPQTGVTRSETPPRRELPPPKRSRLGVALVALALVAGLGGAAVLWRQRSVEVPPAAEVAGSRSIAVLPFQDLSQAKDQEYFCDGLAETLQDMLSKVPQLKVAARTSSFSFKNKNAELATIGEKLHVDSVLEGSVRKEGDRLRVTAKLVGVKDGFQTWSQTYDRQLKDVFSVQDEIAAAVVAALKVQLLPEQVAATAKHRPANLEAYNQALLAKGYFNQTNGPSFQKAVVAYEEAVKLDPTYGAAYAGLALAAAYARDYATDAAEANRLSSRAQIAADRAVELDPDLAESHAARAYLRFLLLWDIEASKVDYQRAMKLDPRDPKTHSRYSVVLATQGLRAEALASALRAAELDPLSSLPWNNLGIFYGANGQFTEARRALRRALELSPSSAFAKYNLATVELVEGNAAVALDLFKGAGGAFGMTGAAMAEHDLGHEEASLKMLDQVIATEALGWAYQISAVYAWRGEADQAFAWLERAYQQRDSGYYGVTYDPLWQKLRKDPRYVAAVQRFLHPK